MAWQVRALDDAAWMGLALDQARQAFDADEVPVGCVIVADGQVLAAARNESVATGDPTAHAESLALRRALRDHRDRVAGSTLYVTLEPCLMCAGAIVLARVGRVVFGCDDPKAGAVRSLYTTLSDDRLNHRCKVVPGVRAAEASDLLVRFFEALRSRRSNGTAGRVTER